MDHFLLSTTVNRSSTLGNDSGCFSRSRKLKEEAQVACARNASTSWQALSRWSSSRQYLVESDFVGLLIVSFKACTVRGGERLYASFQCPGGVVLVFWLFLTGPPVVSWRWSLLSWSSFVGGNMT